jgi:putative Mn2+ efflux pump MntP
VALSGKFAVVNRTQALVLGFFLLVWTGLVVILAAAPEVYDQTLKLPHGDRRPAELAFLAALSAFIALLGIGVLRRWRWTFWLIVVAFLFGVLRVPTSILALTGALPAAGPTWYELVQALVGLLQCAIGLAMLVGYRRAGVWGGF